MPDLNIRPQAQICWQCHLCASWWNVLPVLLSTPFHPGNGQGMPEMGFGLFFYFMHKLSSCCFPYRSREQHGTNHCHCTGGPGPPGLLSSHLPPVPLPQAPVWPREEPSLALLGRSAFPQGAAITPTGLGDQYHDPALPSHTRAACTLPKPGWTWAGQGHRNEPPARELGRGNLILHSQPTGAQECWQLEDVHCANDKAHCGGSITLLLNLCTKELCKQWPDPCTGLLQLLK